MLDCRDIPQNDPRAGTVAPGTLPGGSTPELAVHLSGMASQQSRSILLTNRRMSILAGSETFTRDLALGLLARGHRPTVYTPEPGIVSEELSRLGIPVIDGFSRMQERPDVIHGNQHTELVAAVAQWPEAPAIFTCHSPVDLSDTPPRLQRIRRFVAVDRVRRERLLREPWIAASDVTIIGNSVDLKRFPPRSTPLGPKPQRALLVSNHATRANFGGELESACRTLGLHLEVAGRGWGNVERDVSWRLGAVDIVFGVGRSAMEGMARGAACILCDRDGLGPLVSSASVVRLREHNFGRATATEEISAANLAERLNRYDREDAQQVCSYIRREACLEKMVAEYELEYRRAMEHTKELPEIGEDFRQYAEHIGAMVLNLMSACADSGALPRAAERRESNAIRNLAAIPLH